MLKSKYIRAMRVVAVVPAADGAIDIKSTAEPGGVHAGLAAINGQIATAEHAQLITEVRSAPCVTAIEADREIFANAVVDSEREPAGVDVIARSIKTAVIDVNELTGAGDKKAPFVFRCRDHRCGVRSRQHHFSIGRALAAAVIFAHR